MTSLGQGFKLLGSLGHGTPSSAPAGALGAPHLLQGLCVRQRQRGWGAPVSLLFVSLVDTVLFVFSSGPSLLRSWCWRGGAWAGSRLKATASGAERSNLAAAAGGRAPSSPRSSRPERDSKVCRRRVSPPTWRGGRDVGGERERERGRKMENCAGKMSLGGQARTLRVPPAGLG